MRYSGKKIIFLGSSVTYGYDGWSMCEFVDDTMGCDVKKWAVSGTTLADISDDSYVSRLDRLIDSEDTCDCFVCQLSTNDARKALPLGQISPSKDIKDFDVKTVVGAIEYIVARTTEKWNCPILFYSGTYMDNQNYLLMVDALLFLSKKWGFEVLDLWNDMDMRAVSEQDYNRYMIDCVHPTRLGYTQWWGPRFVDAITQILDNK